MQRSCNYYVRLCVQMRNLFDALQLHVSKNDPRKLGCIDAVLELAKFMAIDRKQIDIT